MGTAEVGGERRERKKKSKVGKTPVGEEKKCRARGSVSTTTDSTMPIDVQSAQSLCRRGAPARAEPSSEAARRRARGRRGGEQEGSEEHVLPFYRGICACAEHVCIHAVPAMRAARLDKSVLARPRTTLCTSAFLQVVVAVSFQRPARDGNVETKPVCSGLL